MCTLYVVWLGLLFPTRAIRGLCECLRRFAQPTMRLSIHAGDIHATRLSLTFLIYFRRLDIVSYTSATGLTRLDPAVICCRDRASLCVGCFDKPFFLLAAACRPRH